VSLPAPYYERNGITIYCGDCREILPQLTNKVDLVLTDFPYGNGTNYDGYQDTPENLQALIQETMLLILSKSKRALITCGVANITKYPEPDWILAWGTPAGSGCSKWGFCCWQPILTYGPDPYLAAGLGRRPDLLIKTETAEKLGHPCSKPIDLWEMVMLRGSIEQTDLILDPFMGSGTTLIAAKKLGRKCIGIEISEKYCAIAVKRLSQEVMDFHTLPNLEKELKSE